MNEAGKVLLASTIRWDDGWAAVIDYNNHRHQIIPVGSKDAADAIVRIAARASLRELAET
jgi:hypothetical protein